MFSGGTTHTWEVHGPRDEVAEPNGTRRRTRQNGHCAQPLGPDMPGSRSTVADGAVNSERRLRGDDALRNTEAGLGSYPPTGSMAIAAFTGRVTDGDPPSRSPQL